MCAQPEKKLKTERLRFTKEEDLILLKEIIANNPFEDMARWIQIHENVVEASGRPFTLRALKERLEYVLRLFSKEDTTNRRKYGTEEEYHEKNLLLQEVKDMQRDFKRERPKNVVSSREKGQMLRQEATTSSSSADPAVATEMENITYFYDEVDPLSDVYGATKTEQINVSDEAYLINNDVAMQHPTLRPSHARSSHQLKDSALVYLERRNIAEADQKNQQLQFEERKLQIEERKIALEERKLALEEEKLRLDKQERLERLQMEKELHQKIMQQQETILSLVSKIMEKLQ